MLRFLIPILTVAALAIAAGRPAKAQEANAVPGALLPPAGTSRPGAIPLSVRPPGVATEVAPGLAAPAGQAPAPSLPGQMVQRAAPGSIAPQPPTPPAPIRITPPGPIPQPAPNVPRSLGGKPGSGLRTVPLTQPATLQPPGVPVFPAHPTPQDRFQRKPAQQLSMPTIPAVSRPRKPVIHPFEQPGAPFDQPIGRPLPEEVTAAPKPLAPMEPRPVQAPKPPVQPLPPLKQAAEKPDCQAAASKAGCAK